MEPISSTIFDRYPLSLKFWALLIVALLQLHIRRSASYTCFAKTFRACARRSGLDHNALRLLCQRRKITINVPEDSKNGSSDRPVQRFTYLPSDDSPKLRLDVYLSGVLPTFSRSAVGDLCERGLVSVNKKNEKKNYRLLPGDEILVEIEPKPDTTIRPENIPLSILFEDEHIIVINKPAGMVVHPAPGSSNGTFVNALVHHLGDSAAALLSVAVSNADADPLFDDEDGLEEEVDVNNSAENEVVDLPETPEAAKASPPSLRPGIVHRLDKGTTGVLIAAKSTDAVARLSSLFKLRKVRKIYLAVCVGHPGETTLVEPIGRSQRNRQLMTVFEGPPGKPAITHVKTVCFDGKLSAVIVRIETGRTHQIRVHLKNRRTPILGDEAYGNRDWNAKIARSDGVTRPLLHAYETEFEHPFTGEKIVLRAPIPEDMMNLMVKMGAAGGNVDGGKVSASDPLIDSTERLLLCSTEVAGRSPGESAHVKGFVPIDRLRLEEENWMSGKLIEVDDD